MSLLRIDAGAAQGCPDAASLARELSSLLPSVTVQDAEEEDNSEVPGPSATVRVEDGGGTYRVWVEQTGREFSDPQRRCSERARAAAVFMAMVIDLPPPPEPPRPAPPPTSMTTTTPSAPAAIATGPASYPIAFIDRPPTLPPRLSEATAELQMTSLQFEGETTTSMVLTANYEIGISRRVQLGMLLSLPVSPYFAFGTWLTSLRVAINGSASFRLDAGLDRLIAPEGDIHDDRAMIALGFPAKWKLSPWFAIVAGGTPGIRFGRFLSLAGLYEGAPLLADTLFSLSIGQHTREGAIAVPFGLLFQPHPKVAIQLSTGVRFEVSQIQQSPVTGGLFIPLAADLIVSPISHMDIGATFSLPGPLLGTSHYTDLRSFGFWLRARY